MWLRSTRSTIGLDIGSNALKAVELRNDRGGYCLAACGREPLAAGCIVQGAIVDRAEVSAAIARLLDRAGIRARAVVVALSGAAVIVKRVALPAMTEDELVNAIYWEAEQYIPFDLQDVHLDFRVLRTDNPIRRDTMEVLLVAAKKEKIAEYTDVVIQAGRVPVVIDVDAFALQNAYELNYGIQPDSVTLLLNLGAESINVNILAGEHLVFTRDIPIGGNHFSDSLQRELDIPPRTAELLKRGQSVEAVNQEDVHAVLRAVSEHVSREVQKTVDFLAANAETGRIDRLVLSGGCSRVPGLADVLAERLAVPVELFDPFRKITIDRHRFEAQDLARLAPAVAVAVGLALRRPGDR